MIGNYVQLSKASHVKSNDEAGSGRQPMKAVYFPSGREREVLKLLAMGKCNKETAKILGISVRTVETYRWRVMKKVQARSTIDLVHYAIRTGIVGLQPVAANAVVVRTSPA